MDYFESEKGFEIFADRNKQCKLRCQGIHVTKTEGNLTGNTSHSCTDLRWQLSQHAGHWFRSCNASRCSRVRNELCHRDF
jgi:hypothetical protein